MTVRVRQLSTEALEPDELLAIRAILDAAFGSDEDERFTQADWDHAVGGVHFVLDVDGVIAAHAAVVQRVIRVGGQPLQTGYVEAVAVDPARQATGLGSTLMAAVNASIAAHDEVGVLGTGSHHFYERLGWRTWQGRAFVRTGDGEARTPDEEGYIMVLATPRSPALDLAASISCEWRPGDVW